jgi:hypothetical protein
LRRESICVSAGFGSLTLRRCENRSDLAIANAAVLALEGKHDEAAILCGNALAHADPGPAGWVLPVDPLPQLTAHPDCWAQTLAMLRGRAA